MGNMQAFKKCTENYVDWVIKLGKTKSALLGFFILAISAIIIQSILDYIFLGKVLASDILRSIVFGLISAPFVIYFFNVIVEQLEKSRVELEQTIYDLGVLRKHDVYLNAKLAQNSKNKSRLMATISHELRTPLNGIIGLSRILLEEDLTEKQQAYLKTINISATSLGHIFSDIIDLEKIDNSRIKLFKQEIEFAQFINDINNFAHLMAEQKHIQFHLNQAENLPEFILIDNARLSQILWNLMSNAVKFTPTGGQIWLNICRIDENHFSFSLKDTGIGIPQAEQSKIFTMFYQAENSQDQKAQGSGIGLAVSKQMALLMGGDLTVESEPNQGATFTLTIEAEATQAKQQIQPQNYALKVLLVEDVEVNVVVARAMLEKFGCDVSVAMNGKEAFSKFEQETFDLILLDIQLPDTTGTEIAQTLRSRYDNEEIDYLPLLVALTANIMQTKKDYQALGLDDVLRKPLSLEALAEVLNTHFSGMIEPIIEPKNLQKNEQIQPLVTSPNETAETQAVEIFDPKMLQELQELMGKSAVLANLELFSQLMPNYVDNLTRYLANWQQNPTAENRKWLADEAHKIKGALASVGLKRLQEIAQFAQTDESEEWDSQIAHWVTLIAQDWQRDMAQMQAFLVNGTL